MTANGDKKLEADLNPVRLLQAGRSAASGLPGQGFLWIELN